MAKRKRTNHELQNITQKTKDQATQTLHKTDAIGSSCSTCGTCCVTLFTNPVISYEWGKDQIAITTNGTEHIRGHLWHRYSCSVTVNQVMIGFFSGSSFQHITVICGTKFSKIVPSLSVSSRLELCRLPLENDIKVQPLLFLCMVNPFLKIIFWSFQDPRFPECNWFWFLVFNATFSNISAISWRPVLVVEETGVPGENHRPSASNL